jgi:hypothetical protein
VSEYQLSELIQHGTSIHIGVNFPPHVMLEMQGLTGATNKVVPLLVTGRVLRSQNHCLCRVYILIPHVPFPETWEVHGGVCISVKTEISGGVLYICIYTFCLHVLNVNF